MFIGERGGWICLTSTVVRWRMEHSMSRISSVICSFLFFFWRRLTSLTCRILFRARRDFPPFFTPGRCRLRTPGSLTGVGQRVSESLSSFLCGDAWGESSGTSQHHSPQVQALFVAAFSSDSPYHWKYSLSAQGEPSS